MKRFPLRGKVAELFWCEFGCRRRVKLGELVGLRRCEGNLVAVFGERDTTDLQVSRMTDLLDLHGFGIDAEQMTVGLLTPCEVNACRTPPEQSWVFVKVLGENNRTTTVCRDNR